MDDAPRAAGREPGEDVVNPYRGVDIEEFLNWWQEHIEDSRAYGMWPYRPARFSDDALVTVLVQGVTERWGVEVLFSARTRIQVIPGRSVSTGWSSAKSSTSDCATVTANTISDRMSSPAWFKGWTPQSSTNDRDRSLPDGPGTDRQGRLTGFLTLTTNLALNWPCVQYLSADHPWCIRWIRTTIVCDTSGRRERRPVGSILNIRTLGHGDRRFRVVKGSFIDREGDV